MKVVLVKSYSTNKTSAYVRPCVYHRGMYYGIGDINSYGATPLRRMGLALKLAAKDYTFIHKDSYIQPGFVTNSADVRVLRVLGDIPEVYAKNFDHVLAEYTRHRLPVREIA